jgi:hypothetical protein
MTRPTSPIVIDFAGYSETEEELKADPIMLAIAEELRMARPRNAAPTAAASRMPRGLRSRLQSMATFRF